MESLDSNVNLGKVTENDFKESTSITILRSIAEKNRKIKVRATEADKIPGLDGKLVIIDENNFERIHIEMQVKTLPKDYNIKESYSYSCDTKAINIVLYHVTFNPVVLILVDEESQKVFWKLISNEYAKELNIGTQKNKTIYFSEQDLFDEDSFINKLDNYCDSLYEIIDKKDANQSLILSNIVETSQEYIDVQKQIDRLNNLFDNELSYIKALFFRNVWKFGISYIKSSRQSAFGIYPILYGKNDTLIKQFDPRLKYLNMSLNFVKSITLEEYINKWIKNIKKEYYLKVPINIEKLSDDILNELVFNFLDKLTINIKILEDKRKILTYYKDEESISNIINTINGIELFFEEIIKTKDNPNPSNAVTLLTPTYNITGKFLIFNYFIQFNDEENKLLSKYLSQNNPSVPLKFFDSDEDKIKMSLSAISELQKRGKRQVKRLWNKKDIKQCNEDFQKGTKSIRTGYSQKDLISNWKHFFEIITSNYNFVFNKTESPENCRLNELHCINIDNKNIGDYSDFILKNDNFQVKIINNDSKIDISNILHKIYSNLDSLFLLDTPLYEIVRILLSIGVLKQNGYIIKNKNITENIKFDELPIINYYTK